MSQLPDNNYQNILTHLKEKIRRARLHASVKVNFELLKIYWEIGNTILEQQKQQGWGAKIIDKLAVDLKIEFPDFKGLSVRNLKYMRAFAASYPAFLQFVQPPVAQLNNTIESLFVLPAAAQIPWTHHTIILDKIKTTEERQFYIEKTVQNGWSKAILSLQIENGLYGRQGKALTNFSRTLPAIQSDLANETLKNPYIFDFLTYSEEIKERELEKALIQHLKKFMLELGRGFAYVGNQKNINVNGDDFFLDLLFFNYNLDCFVIIELKVGDFKPEFAGKLTFYVNTINEQLKGTHHKPTIGVLLCKTPNKTVVEYSLKGIESPIGVADYELAKALPKELRGEIPSIAELEAEIEKEYEELKTPSQKRFDSLKEKLTTLKGNEIKHTATTQILFDIFDQSLMPLYTALLARMEAFTEMFLSFDYQWEGKSKIERIGALAEEWKNEGFLKSKMTFYFSCRLNGFKKGGTEAFSTGFQLNYITDQYWYGFTLVNYNNQQPVIKKLYHEQLTPNDIDEIVETVYNFVIDEIENNIKRIKR